MIKEIYTKFMLVTEEDLATKWGSRKARVYSTPAMIAFMEITSDENLARFLDEGYISVGIGVNIRHLRASKLGSNIKCISEIIKKDKNRVTFNVKCFDKDNLIGEGIHERYIVNKEKFEDGV